MKKEKQRQFNNVLITGGDGFIGSHLAEKFVKEGYHVRVLCKYNSLSSLGWLDNSPYLKNMEVILGDIEDEFLVKKSLKNIDLVFNLAALISIPYSYEAFSSYLKTNVMGTLNLLKAALECDIKKFIFLVKFLGEYVPIDEKHPLQPQSPILHLFI